MTRVSGKFLTSDKHSASQNFKNATHFVSHEATVGAISI